MKTWEFYKPFVVISLSVLALSGAVVGIYSAMHSGLFTLAAVEVVQEGHAVSTEKNNPLTLDAVKVRELSGAQLGKDNLFDMDLEEIEHRILTHVWIREVTLEKRFPKTLKIIVKLREPIALAQSADGTLQYMDSNGELFSEADASILADLPVVFGIPENQDTEKGLQENIIKLLDYWKNSEIGKFTKLSSISWDVTRGIRAVVLYLTSSQAEPARTIVGFGQNFDAQTSSAMPHLGKVLQYLANHSIRSSTVSVGDGKKIVVKTDLGL